MAITSIDIDPDLLAQAKATTGASSNREAVDIALRRLLAMHRQQAAVERIIARRFEPDQIDAPTITPTFLPGTSAGS
ncbi:Arc/MetJ family transcription regulator [Leifsonia sp. EB41]|jgi:Arc/MetJ family transcription regulator|uniref:type II toxin-antitoxin system VapB family antitoxin n=1 Tax=Leifsonia sp. EB41 TaxID=3156260 RepID=UPI0035120A41